MATNSMQKLVGQSKGTFEVIDTDGVTQINVDGVAITATPAEINAATDVSSRLVTVTDAATYTVLAANSGKTHVIPDLTASCTITLPAASAGLEYEFIYGGVAADAQNWVIQGAGATALYYGGTVHLDTDAGSAGDEIVPVYPNGSSNYILTVTTPEAGTSVRVISDGTHWYANGTVVSATAPAFSG